MAVAGTVNRVALACVVLALGLQPAAMAAELSGPQASALLQQAAAATSQGDSATALRLWAELIPWLQRNTPSGSPLVAQSLLQLGDAQSSQKQVRQAEASYRQALQLARALIQPRPKLVAILLNNLADLYADLERFAEAKVLLQESLDLKIKTLGPDHPEVGIGHSNLADLLREMGEQGAAENQISRSLAILTPLASEQPLALAAALNNASRLQQRQGAWSQAQHSYEQAQQLRLKALPPDHEDLALGWNNLGMLALSRGDFKTAQLHLERAYAQTRRHHGDGHVLTAGQLANLARLDAERGQLLQGVQKFKRAQQVLDKQLGQGHPDSLHNLADLLLLQHRMGSSAELSKPLERLLRSRFALFSEQASQLLPRERLLLLRRRDPSWYLADALAQRQPSAAQLALALRLNTQGLLQELQREQRQGGNATDPKQKRRWIKPAEVAAALPAGAVLIELRRFLDPAQIPTATDTPLPWRYRAYVLNERGNLTIVELGSQAILEPLLRLAYTATAEQLSDAAERWDALSTAILKPLRAAAGKATTWFIVPDAALHQVPFQALLPDRQVRLLNTGRDLLRTQQASKANASAVVVAGNPAISKSLAGSALEARGIARLLATTPVEGSAFNRTLLVQLRSPRMLHLATHGFWQDINHGGSARTVDSEPAQDPMLRSGIVVSNDDRVSAADFLGLDLKATELVTLSGCSTGLGDLHDSEGLFGLQRGIQVAGARSVLTSLWPVEDAATSDWMLRFYSLLKQGHGRADALAAVQSAFRDHPNPQWRHPYYWAGWQLVGDWRPIEGLQ